MRTATVRAGANEGLASRTGPPEALEGEKLELLLFLNSPHENETTGA